MVGLSHLSQVGSLQIPFYGLGFPCLAIFFLQSRERTLVFTLKITIISIPIYKEESSNRIEDHGVYKIHYDFEVIDID